VEKKMKEEILKIEEYDGMGYKPLVDYGSWRVAFLRFIDELIPENIQKLERHVETDEVFVLLEGKAVLFLGEGDRELQKLHFQEMEPGKLFNVKKNAWHACVLSKDATILLVENRDTGKENTDYLPLNPLQKKSLIEISGKYIQEWHN